MPDNANPSAPVDYFAVLDVPHRPWLDVDALKQRFLTLSSQFHPDRYHNAPEAERAEATKHYTELNAAWQCLRDPKDRLRHLLELETGSTPASLAAAPPELTGMFFVVGQLCREANTFIDEKTRAQSPLLQAKLMAERGAELAGRLQSVQQDLNRSTEALLTGLSVVNKAWQTEDPEKRATGLRHVETVYRALGFLGRWSEQLQELIVRLTM